jgi:lipopolysaccharide transport system permease protein
MTSERSVSDIVIRARTGWLGFGVGDVFRSHELLYFLVWRDLKVRYKQTVFGALWALLQPLGLLVVFSATVGRLQGVAPGSVPYPVFAFAALVPWGLFATGLVAVSGSLVNASSLLQKVYFPRLVLPLAAAGVSLVDYAVALVALAVIFALYAVPVTLGVLWLIPLTALAVLTILGVGIWLAAINVKYRDVRHAVPFVVQIWLFASPVAYSADLIPARWATVYALNPMVGVIDGFRWALLGGETPAVPLALAAVVSGILLVTGIAYFRRVERTFADVI